MSQDNLRHAQYGADGIQVDNPQDLLRILAEGRPAAPLMSPEVAAASANQEALQTSLNENSSTYISGGQGIIWIDKSLVMPSDRELFVGAGTTIKFTSGRTNPVIKNKYCGQIHNQNKFSRYSNIVTVLDAGHSFEVGDQQFISGANAAFRGLVTISAVTTDTWSYYLAGADGSAGATGVYFNVIPVRRTLNGSNFISASDYVTVNDPGHSLYPGMNVYLGVVGGSTFAPGVVVVAEVGPNSWSYVATGSGTGNAGAVTVVLSYDTNITIHGGGVIDGNRANAGVPDSNVINGGTAVFGCVSNLRIGTAIGGSGTRGVATFNCANITYNENWRGFDCLVAMQQEGGANGVLVDQNLAGASAFFSESAQQIDDYCAFTGTAFAGGAPGNYDNTISPYGLTFFAGIEVRRIYPVACLNAVKITAHSSCRFLGTVKIGSIISRVLNRRLSLGQGAAVTVFDDGPGLVGTTVDAIDISGPVEWLAPAGSTAVFNLAGAGSIGRLQLRNYIAETGATTSIKVSNSITITALDIDSSKFIPMAAATPAILINGGTIRAFVLRNSSAVISTGQSLLTASGGAIHDIEINSVKVSSLAAANGELINLTGGASATTRIALKSVSILSGGNSIGRPIYLGDFAYGTLNVFLENTDLTSASMVSTSGTAITGTFNIYANKSVKWTATGGNNFLQCGGGSWNLYGESGFSCNADRLALFGYGTPTYRLQMPSNAAGVNMNSGNYVGAQIVPVNGDMIWNNNAGALAVGIVVRRAGAWTAL